MQYIFLSHDVDWRREGPSKKHLLDRKDRFSNKIINSLNEKNPYYNFPEYMEIEESMDIKSTFFFRTMYENGNYLDYENEISDLIKGGWEIGLHLDPTSVNDFTKIKHEKINLEKLTKHKIIGNRVHFLKYDEDLSTKLKELEFTYDSSVRYSKDKIDKNEMGFIKKNGIYQFPITWMDAYLFTYMKITEDKLVSIFENTLNFSRNLGEDNVLTLLWHDNVLKMKGGRKYKEILEFLVSQDDVVILPGKDIVNILK
jgi:hypothetical protein